MSQNLLEISDFCVSYGAVQAVHQVSLSIAEGEIVAVIGPNGAGKSTLLCAIMGLLPASGQLRLDGLAMRKIQVEAMVARGDEASTAASVAAADAPAAAGGASSQYCSARPMSTTQRTRQLLSRPRCFRR